SRGAFRVRPGAADLLEDRLEQRERAEDVIAREGPRAVGTAGRQCLPDGAVLLCVPRVEAVDRVVAGRPDRRAREGAARALRELLDERQAGDAVDDVVEGVVRAYPLPHDRAPLLSGLARAEILRDLGEVLLGFLELHEILGRYLPRCDLGREGLELGAHHERLVQLLPGDRADADAA